MATQTRAERKSAAGLTREQFKAELGKAGLTPISMHSDIKALASAMDSTKLLDDAKFYGLKYIGNAWFPHEGTFDQADAGYPEEGPPGADPTGPGGWRSTRCARSTGRAPTPTSCSPTCSPSAA